MKRFLPALALLLSLVPLGVAAAPPSPRAPAGLRKAAFAGGCFWCMQPPFDKTPGVVSTAAGYTGGQKANPTYEEVSDGGTGHAESVEVVYDPAKVSYKQLLDVYWRNVDPFDPGGQFCDHGTQYRSAIFVASPDERREAEESKRAVEKRFGKAASTEIAPASTFWAAEEYHQAYYKKNPLRYGFYRRGCGRDARLEALWGKGDH